MNFKSECEWKCVVNSIWAATYGLLNKISNVNMKLPVSIHSVNIENKSKVLLNIENKSKYQIVISIM